MCSDNTVAVAAGLAVGAIVAIAIGAVAGAAILTYAGKKGYESLIKNKVEQTSVNNNPLYETNPEVNVENPMYEDAN